MATPEELSRQRAELDKILGNDTSFQETAALMRAHGAVSGESDTQPESDDASLSGPAQTGDALTDKLPDDIVVLAEGSDEVVLPNQHALTEPKDIEDDPFYGDSWWGDGMSEETNLLIDREDRGHPQILCRVRIEAELPKHLDRNLSEDGIVVFVEGTTSLAPTSQS